MVNRNKVFDGIEKGNPEVGIDLFGESICDLLNEKQMPVLPNKDKEKILNLTRECESLISKVFMLKERELHIRSVVLNLLKTMDLKAVKK